MRTDRQSYSLARAAAKPAVENSNESMRRWAGVGGTELHLGIGGGGETGGYPFAWQLAVKCIRAGLLAKLVRRLHSSTGRQGLGLQTTEDQYCVGSYAQRITYGRVLPPRACCARLLIGIRRHQHFANESSASQSHHQSLACFPSLFFPSDAYSVREVGAAFAASPSSRHGTNIGLNKSRGIVHCLYSFCLA